jgi:integrase
MINFSPLPCEVLRLLRLCAGQACEQRRRQATHLADVLRKRSARCPSTTSRNSQRTPGKGIRLSELAGIRYDPDDPKHGDIDLWHREITVHGKGGKTRTVKISHDDARALDRYLRARARHAQAHRPQLWLGINNRGPMTASGICQVIARRGRQCSMEVFPHRFRHHFSHSWLDRDGAEGDLMELNGWTSPQMLRRYGASARSARARRSYDRVMENTP